jgi:hypothetical protein
VDPRERKAILGEGGVRDADTREIARGKVLERDLEGSPLVGRPLPRRLRNFRPSVDRIVASLGGPLPYMVRLREIETQTASHERELEQAWLELAKEYDGDGAGFERGWRRIAELWDFGAVNDLIDRHNRYYPAEARLPMDPRTRDFVLVNGQPYDRRPLDAAWVLACFPPEGPKRRSRQDPPAPGAARRRALPAPARDRD